MHEGQQLLVHHGGRWHQAAVTGRTGVGSATHQLQLDGQQKIILLHPWNHAPLELPYTEFEVLRSRHASAMRARHASVVDALSGRRLDVFGQCVPIKVVSTGTQADTRLAHVVEVHGLAEWLCNAHMMRCKALDLTSPSCLILSAEPAAGKTCLMSQLVMHTLNHKSSDLVPILIKVEELHRLLTGAHAHYFGRAWNWVDAYLQIVHGTESDLYRMLRQVLSARRALILLDGIDEGGKRRTEIERHITQVLAPQGHVMLVTSRPNGLREELFKDNFLHLKLEPLSDQQQFTVIEQRIGKGERAEQLAEFVRGSFNKDAGQRVTGNPLMLSMVISIFESRREGTGSMPKTVAELYKIASRTMLERIDRKERGAAASAAALPHLTALLEAAFFEAHLVQERIIDDARLSRAARSAARGMWAPEKLCALDAAFGGAHCIQERTAANDVTTYTGYLLLT
jgi:hypothetical protein